MTVEISPLSPPADVPEIQRGNWYPLPVDEPVVAYISSELWEYPVESLAWEVARLSKAVYVYKEINTRWKVAVKFFSVKTGDTAEKYANREFNLTQEAQLLSLSEDEFRAVKPLSVWQGALFLEYVDGLTLEDIIAIRRSRPGTLLPAIKKTAKFLARLHANAVRADEPLHFDWEINDTWEIFHKLANHGVLKDNPVVQGGLEFLIDRWAGNLQMMTYTPVITHGDATTSNFVFPWEGEMIAIDWERARPADPAADLGRLMAELGHSLNQHGGSVAEAHPFVEHLAASYQQALPADWDADALLERARFFQASSTLRIARNGWVSRLDRTALVAQAMELLS